jgi:Patatin-like phospholipase
LDYRFEEDGHPRHKESMNVENILVLQGGGSLGAFACGVFKALVKKNVRIDIIAGTSIGAVNAAIIVGSKSGHPEKDLEDFWMELAESNLNIIPDIFVLDYDSKSKKYISKKYLLLRLMLQCLVFPKCLLLYGYVGFLGVMIMRITIKSLIAIKQSSQNTTMTFLIQETGLMYMIILHLQKHLINI